MHSNISNMPPVHTVCALGAVVSMPLYLCNLHYVTDL